VGLRQGAPSVRRVPPTTLSCPPCVAEPYAKGGPLAAPVAAAMLLGGNAEVPKLLVSQGADPSPSEAERSANCLQLIFAAGWTAKTIGFSMPGAVASRSEQT